MQEAVDREWCAFSRPRATRSSCSRCLPPWFLPWTIFIPTGHGAFKVAQAASPCAGFSRGPPGTATHVERMVARADSTGHALLHTERRTRLRETVGTASSCRATSSERARELCCAEKARRLTKARLRRTLRRTRKTAGSRRPLGRHYRTECGRPPRGRRHP